MITTENFKENISRIIKLSSCNTNFKPLLAVSGGADSMCMAYLIHEAEFEDVGVAIVDHCLRPESSDEAHYVKSIIEQKLYRFKVMVLSWDGAKPKSNIQSKARTARYKLLTDYAISHGYTHIFTAHNLNDNAETVLMRIIRGTGLTGLTGIKEVGAHNEVPVFRPMLCYTRSQIISTLQECKMEWVEDPSNQNPKYFRTKMREVLHAFPNYEQTLHRLNLLSQNAARAESYITHSLENAVCAYVHEREQALIIKRSDYISLHEELRLRLLKKLILDISMLQERGVRMDSLIILDQHINQSRKASTLHNVVIRYNPRTDELIFTKECVAFNG